MSLSSELLKKYNVPGPRYTSYPTVPYWEKTPTQSEWIESIGKGLDESERLGVGAALYLHIPFCESLCTYCGCNTRITRNRTVGTPYVEALHREWALYLKLLGRRVRLSDLHLGGGTPTFLAPEELDRMMKGILASAEIAPDAEFSLEADPRVTREEHLRVLAGHGFRRLSLGIQDFDPKVQEIVHRIQSEAQVQDVVDFARKHDYQSINFDLIYGLPFQTEESVRMTIEKVMRIRPDRIAFYAYAHVPWIKPSQRRFTEADLPVGDQKRALYELGRSKLEEAGYREIGMDHFALESDSLWKAAQSGALHRNFMGYTSRHVAPLIGIGVSSIGDSWSAFAQNEKLLETYYARIEKGELPILRGHVLNEEDQVLRRHILDLMTRFETRWEGHGPAAAYLDEIPGKLEELAQDGLVELKPGLCRIPKEGRPVLRNICMAFDARLARKAPDTQLFSKTI